MVRLVGLLLGVFDTLEAAGLDVDLEVPTLVEAKGDPVETHLPAMEVAVDVDGRVGHALVDEVVAGGDCHLPLGGDVDIAGKAERLDDVVVEIVLRSHIGADIAEGVAEGDVPRHGEIGIGAHQKGRIVVVGRLHDGGHNLLALGLGAGLATGIGVEGVVVEAP